MTRPSGLIEPKRLPHTRLGFAVQVTTLLFLGTFLTDPADVPTEVVDYLAEQLGIEDPSCVKAYRSREMTRLEHAREIRDAYGFVEFTPHVLRHTAGTTMTRAGVDRHPPYTRPRHVRAAELSITSAAAATSPCTRTAI